MASSKETGLKIEICVFIDGVGAGLIEDMVSILLSLRAGKRSTICLPFEEVFATLELLVALSGILSLMVFLTHLIYIWDIQQAPIQAYVVFYGFGHLRRC